MFSKRPLPLKKLSAGFASVWQLKFLFIFQSNKMRAKMSDLNMWFSGLDVTADLTFCLLNALIGQQRQGMGRGHTGVLWAALGSERRPAGVRRGRLRVARVRRLSTSAGVRSLPPPVLPPRSAATEQHSAHPHSTGDGRPATGVDRRPQVRERKPHTTSC